MSHSPCDVNVAVLDSQQVESSIMDALWSGKLSKYGTGQDTWKFQLEVRKTKENIRHGTGKL